MLEPFAKFESSYLARNYRRTGAKFGFNDLESRGSKCKNFTQRTSSIIDFVSSSRRLIVLILIRLPRLYAIYVYSRQTPLMIFKTVSLYLLSCVGRIPIDTSCDYLFVEMRLLLGG